MTTHADNEPAAPPRRRTFGDVLAEIHADEPGGTAKGAAFERLVKRYFQQDALYSQTFSNVWLWSEWPGNPGRPDTGVDIVAELRSGAGLAAIQCKFYAPDTRIDKAEIDSFMTESGREGFVERYIVTTTSNWSRNALAALPGQQIQTIRIGPQDFELSSIDWAAFRLDEPQTMERKEPKRTRPHQQEAIDDVIAGFEAHDRGKLIMACGTGKTYAALRIAEQTAPPGGTILFLTPSLQLVSQSLRDWANDMAAPMRFFAVCSDPTVGKTNVGRARARRADEDEAEIESFEMVIPATTSADKLLANWPRRSAGDDADAEGAPRNVIFSTYQSLDVVIDAQTKGLPEFDLVVCDEAHRTTGVTLANADESEFTKVHSDGNLRAKKRLYMTATPRIFSEKSKGKAREADAALASMDDESVYGPEFHRLEFGKAVENELLCDYRVIIFGVSEQAVASDVQAALSSGEGNLNLTDAAKIVASWNALSKQKSEYEDFESDPEPMRRVVAFAGRIQQSKDFAKAFNGAISEYKERNGIRDALVYTSDHVDGTMNSMRRAEKLQWLKADAEGECRILSNARCLTEGVDVPDLDGALFLSPRRSVVDVVQAVGRAMRKAEGKKFGYIVIPIAVAPDGDYKKAILDSNYNPTWQVLQALKAHDESFYDSLNQTDLRLNNGKVSVIFDESLKTADSEADAAQAAGEIAQQIALPISEELRAALYAKIVDSLTDKHYYRRWAADVQRISEEYEARINALLDSGDPRMNAEFDAFLASLRRDVNDGVTREAAVEMLGQHLVSKPVFDALFEGGEFARRNPVAQGMDRITDYLNGEHSAENERQRLARFYDSIHRRVRKVDSAEAKQQIIKDLYGEFFRLAMPKAAASLGIVYTPVEAVDFILRSVEDVLRAEFGASLAGEGVHILDPFVGTGTFIARLLSGGFAGERENLARKYAGELYANEIVLLAYYVAAANIEAAYRDAAGAPDYAPFPGVALADTFQLAEYRNRPTLSNAFIQGNSERIDRQTAADIRVIIGNPPWSIGQGSANDENKNREYPALRARIAETYASRSDAKLQRALYDTYVQAIRWASDRISESERGGVVAFITNGGFIDSLGGDGLRKSLSEEFHKVYCLNLRGNLRAAGENARREGGNVFPVRAGNAVLICVKKPDAPSGAALLYRDIGDYLSREAKLAYLKANRLAGLPWETIVPNAAGDWINQRSDEFPTLFPLYGEGGVFIVDSLGVVTNRDPWCYNFSKSEVEANIEDTIRFFNSQQDALNPIVDETRFNWTREARRDLAAGVKYAYDESAIVDSVYRPFTKQNLYFQSRIVNVPGKIARFYPDSTAENIGFAVSENSSQRFSCLATNVVPNLSILGETGRYLPRWTYAHTAVGNGKRERVSNISPAALAAFRKRYETDAITEDDLFHYCYGVLHHEGYRTKFANDLAKEAARVPMAASLDDFEAFAEAGRELADLHVNYESVEPYPLHEDSDMLWASKPGAYRVEKMAYAGKRPDLDKSRIVYNEGITLSGIPAIAHDYRLGSRSALDWLIDRYQIKRDKDSGILNDPNAWPDERNSPRYILDLVKRITAISVRTTQIVRALPTLPDCG